jgi:hypothetical protein
MKKAFKRVKARLSRGRSSGSSGPSALASGVGRAEEYPTTERPEVSTGTPRITYAMKFFWQLATKDSDALRNALSTNPYCILRTRRPKNGEIHPDDINAERELLTKEDKALHLSRLEGRCDSERLTPGEYTLGTISELDRWMAFILEWQQKLEAVQKGQDMIHDIFVGTPANRLPIRLPMSIFALRSATTDSYVFAHRNLYSSILWRLSWRGLVIECSGEESALGEPGMPKHACPELHWEWYDMDSIVILPGKLRITTGVGPRKQLPPYLEQPTKKPGCPPATTPVAGHLDDLHQQINYWYTHMDEKFFFEIEIPEDFRISVKGLISSVELLHYFELFHCGTEPGPVQRWVEPSWRAYEPSRGVLVNDLRARGNIRRGQDS